MRPHLLILVAWLLNVAAWFLPTVTDVGPPLPGAYAFLIALGAFPPDSIFFRTWYDALLALLSATTSLFFIVGSPWVLVRGTRPLRHSSAWVAGVAFVFNAHWYIRPMARLGIGYFLWWVSFAVLAVGLFDLVGIDASEETHRQTTPLPG